MTQPDQTKRKLLAPEAWLTLVLARIGGGAKIHAAGRQLDLALTALPQAVLRPLLMYRIDATIDGHRASVMASPRLIEQMIATVLPDARLASLNTTTRALALEAALADALDDLEARLGVEIVVHGIVEGHTADADEPMATAGLRMSVDRQPPLLVPVALPEPVLRKLVALQAGVGAKDPALDPEVPLAVRVGRGASTASEIANLSENDVVVLEDTLLDDNRVCLVVDDLYAALGELDGKSMKLDGPLAAMDQGFLSRFSGASDRTKRPGAASNGSEPLLPVVADLAYRMAPVSELLRIDPNDPVPLPQAIEGIVELRANRRRVATGRLVRVGGAVGVRILRTDAHGRS